MRGCSIVYARIVDLRKLIEAVQAHPDAVLAPASEKRDEDWIAPNIFDDIRPTSLAFFGGEVILAECGKLDTRIMLFAQTRFVGNVDFSHTQFGADVMLLASRIESDARFHSTLFHGTFIVGATIANGANFGGARFVSDVSFANSRFELSVNFHEAAFQSRTSFDGTAFAGGVIFKNAVFSNDVMFLGTSFETDTSFHHAKFNDFLSFRYAKLGDRVFFNGAFISRLLSLKNIHRHPRELHLHRLDLRPGATVEMDLAHIEREDASATQNPDDPWIIERDSISNRIASMKPDSQLRWLFEYIDVVCCIRHPIRHFFGLGKRGNVLDGDLGKTPDDLRRAAAQYTILRNNFRTQPSAEAIEDVCHFRYMELTRRAAWRDNPTVKEQISLGFEWLVMRNMLGYMIRPARIIATTAFFLITFTMIFAFFGGEGTITHNGISDQAAAVAEWKSNPLNPLYFSLMTFVTLGYGDFAPLGWFKLVCGLEGLLGVTLLALFTVAWGRKMIR